MADAIKILHDIVKDNWTNANTDSITPQFFYGEVIPGTTESDAKRLDLREKAAVRFYMTDPAEIVPNGFGTKSQRETYIIQVDIRTMKSRVHCRKIIDEVRRICNSRIIAPNSSFDILDLTEERDESNNNTGLWRWILKFNLINYNKARAT